MLRIGQKLRCRGLSRIKTKILRTLPTLQQQHTLLIEHERKTINDNDQPVSVNP